MEKLIWLRRSIIIKTSKPWDVSEITFVLSPIWPKFPMVRDMGNFKFITTFESVDDMDSAYMQGLKDGENVWVNIRKWSPLEVCMKQCVWLDIYGIPPQA